MEIYEASDYAGLKAGPYKFYYGYEQVFCPTHKQLGLQKQTSCANNEEDETEWCFVAEKDGKDLAFYSQRELEPLVVENSDSTAHYLLAGITNLIEKKLLGGDA